MSLLKLQCGAGAVSSVMVKEYMYAMVFCSWCRFGVGDIAVPVQVNGVSVIPLCKSKKNIFDI